MKMIATTALALASLGLAWAPAFAIPRAQSAPPTYRLVDIGSLGSGYSEIASINQLGTVTGSSYTGEFDFHGFIYKRDMMTDIGTLGGSNTSAFGINDFNMISGVSDLADGYESHAFLYSDGRMRDLGLLGGSYSEALAVNDLGVVVGDSDLAGDEIYHAVIYERGGIEDIGTLGGINSLAYGINLTGQVTGRADLPGVSASGIPIAHAYIYFRGKMLDIGKNAGDYSEGYRINDLGEVTGTVASAADDDYHAMLYRRSRITDLGTLGGTNSHGYGINNLGHVTGRSTLVTGVDLDDPFAYHGFFYDGTTMYDLNDLIDPQDPLADQVTLVTGDAINDLGWIAADGINLNTGEYHGYILRPVALSHGPWFHSAHRSIDVAHRPARTMKFGSPRFRSKFAQEATPGLH